MYWIITSNIATRRFQNECFDDSQIFKIDNQKSDIMSINIAIFQTTNVWVSNLIFNNLIFLQCKIKKLFRIFAISSFKHAFFIDNDSISIREDNNYFANVFDNCHWDFAISNIILHFSSSRFFNQLNTQFVNLLFQLHTLFVNHKVMKKSYYDDCAFD